ncbi:MAG: hypothetical protein J6W00_13355 [Lentisphaeria bacterium]|nr:hypothetical protein [Lentisphaeria bacterium]
MYTEVQEITLKDTYLHAFFDFGKDAFSTVEIEVNPPFDANVEVILGEVAENGKIIHTPGYRTFIQRIIRTRTGKQVIKIDIPPFIPAFSGFPHCHAPAMAGGEFAPFRYVEVNRTFGDITVRRTAYFNDWDDNASTFESSNEKLDKIWDFCKYSIKAVTAFDKYIDGERERMPYEGDAFINQLGHFCHTLNFDIARHTIDHFFEHGKYTWPTECLLLTPTIIRDYMLYSGDTASLKRWLPLLEEKLLAGALDEKGLLNQDLYKNIRPGCRTNDLIDWPATERDGYEVGKVNLSPNAFLYGALKVMFELTGEKSYLNRADQLKKAIRTHLLKEGRFVDSIDSEHTAIHTAIAALYFDLAEDDEINFCRDEILSKDMACGVYISHYLLEACFRYDMAEHAVKLITSESKRSWFNMLREGSTVTMEAWGVEFKPNMDWNHAFAAAPANIIPRMFCGIRPVEPGFKRFIVDPRPGNVESFSFRMPTVKGEIKLEWSKDKKQLTVPENTEALYQGKILTAGTYELD